MKIINKTARIRISQNAIISLFFLSAIYCFADSENQPILFTSGELGYGASFGIPFGFQAGAGILFDQTYYGKLNLAFCGGFNADTKLGGLGIGFDVGSYFLRYFQVQLGAGYVLIGTVPNSSGVKNSISYAYIGPGVGLDFPRILNIPGGRMSLIFSAPVILYQTELNDKLGTFYLGDQLKTIFPAILDPFRFEVGIEISLYL